MKFTKGYWLNRPGVEAADAVQIREVKSKKNRVYLYSVPYPQDVRAMGGPVLRCSSLLPRRTSSAHRRTILWEALKKPQFERRWRTIPWM